EILARVGRHHEGAEGRVVDLDELPDLASAVVDEAEARVRVAGIAAELALRRLLQHHDALGAGLARRHRRLVCRAAAADDTDVPLFRAQPLLRANGSSARPRFAWPPFVQCVTTASDRQAVTGSLRALALCSSEPKPLTEMSKLFPSGSVARVSA